MSSRRLQEDYRRILGITEDIRGIDPALPRMRIAGARGIYQQGDGTRKSGAAPSEDTDPVTPDETDTNSNEDGSGQGDQNTGDGIGGGGDDGSDFIINPEDPPAGVDVDSDTFGGNWASGGPKSFVDCETNQCIELVEVGGYVPPEGWDDADTPPIDPTYQSGYHWEVGTGGNIASSPAVLCDRLKSGVQFVNSIGLFVTQTNAEGIPTNYRCAYTFRTCEECADIDRNILLLRRVNPNPCAGEHCSMDQPDYWPSDDCIQLAPNADGNWAPSIRESPNDMIAKYSEPKSTLELCTPSGEIVDVYQRVDGGHVYFNRDQGIWAGSDSSGRMRSFGSSSTLNQEIARPRN